MLVYPLSIIGYFILGVAGACTFMFLLLVFDKDINMLRNPMVKLPWMMLMYGVLGGVVSVVINLTSSPDLGAGQLTLGFSAGMGWPALATGISAAKKVSDVAEDGEKRFEKAKESLEAMEDRKLKEREEFYTEKIRDGEKTLKNVNELLDLEIEKVKEYYSERLKSAEGGE